MIFRLISITIFATIIIETNSIPVSLIKSQSNELDDEDASDKLILISDIPLDYEFSDGEMKIHDGGNNTLYEINNDTLKLIENDENIRGKVIILSDENIDDSTNPLQDNLKTNLIPSILGRLGLKVVRGQIIGIIVKTAVKASFTGSEDSANKNKI